MIHIGIFRVKIGPKSLESLDNGVIYWLIFL